jgi:2-phospho-L-lactate guanylyltransferase
VTAVPGAEVSVVVLAKDRSRAKTRLLRDRGLASEVAFELARRTMETALEARCARSVFVVTSDRAISREAASLGVAVVAEGRPVGVNGAAAMGRRRALVNHPDLPVAIMVADLPHLSAGELEAVAAEQAGHGLPLYVPDHLGVGTTCLIHGPDRRPGLAFGRNSAAMHHRLGYVAAQRPVRGLRFDLDTPEDLALAEGQAIRGLSLT